MIERNSNDCLLSMSHPNGKVRMEEERYSSDLSDEEWLLLRPPLCRKRRGPKIPEHVVRGHMNGIFYVTKMGCQWDMLPKCYGKANTVRRRFARWRDQGLWEEINAALVKQGRVKEGRPEEPTAAIIDAQSVKTAQKGGPSAMTRARRPRAASVI